MCHCPQESPPLKERRSVQPGLHSPPAARATLMKQQSSDEEYVASGVINEFAVCPLLL